jgi:hypothetical protein
MVLSPAQRHLANHRASVIALAAGALATAGALVAPPHPEEGEDAQTYRLLMAQLIEHRRQLKDIGATEKKIEAKRGMVEYYDDYVDAVLDAGEKTGKAVQDDIVVTMMIWHLDLEHWSRAFQIAAHVLQFGLQMPPPFTRGVPTFLAEQVADAALKADTLDQDFPLDVLQEVFAMVQPYDIYDVVGAKLRKAIGFRFLRISKADNPDGPAGGTEAAKRAALEWLRGAYSIDEKCGVKKEMEILQRALKKLPAETLATETATAETDQ